MTSRRSGSPRDLVPRRGVIMLSVLVVVGIGALVGTTVMLGAMGERASADVAVDRTQARALAWSGVQAAMAELAAQREDLLAGLAPSLTAEWTLFTDEEGRRGVVRLLPIAADGGPAVSELAKLDVNRASEEMLAGLPDVGEDLARAIVEARKDRPFQSVEDLARAEGMTADLLFGVSDAGPDAAGGRGLAMSDGQPPGAGRQGGLIDVLTVFAFDANVQAGLGEDGEPHRGKLRINLNTPWSQELADGVADRFGADSVKGVQEVFESGAAFTSDGDIVDKLRELGAPPESWAVFLDAFTTCPDPYLVGRVDLSTAPADVLACVPGLDAESAGQIVAARERLDAPTRQDPAWPAAAKIVTPEAFAKAADYTTTRSLVWRVRVQSGVLAPGADEGAPLGQKMVLDAVIDVASERARVAYVRDVTHLEASLSMARVGAADEGLADEEEAEDISDGVGPAMRESTPDGRAGAPEGAAARPSAPGPPSADDPGAPPSAPGAGPPVPPAAEPAAAPARPEARDRRLGRWAPGEKGGAP